MPLLSRDEVAQPTEQDVKAIAIALLARAPLNSTIDSIKKILHAPEPSVRPSVTLAMSTPLPGWDGPDGATAQTVQHEVIYRSLYIANATLRLEREQENLTARRQMMDKEREFYLQSRNGAAQRMQKARLVDMAASKYGRKLGWYAIPDPNISTACLKANRKNFYVDRRPAIGYPGQVHVGCRCRPGKPFNTTATVYSIPAER